jgi:hypothetical protein
MTQISLRDHLFVTRSMECGGKLSRKRFDLREAVATRMRDSLCVGFEGVGCAAFDARDFGAHQLASSDEILWASSRPDRQLRGVSLQSIFLHRVALRQREQREGTIKRQLAALREGTRCVGVRFGALARFVRVCKIAE